MGACGRVWAREGACGRVLARVRLSASVCA